MKNCIWGVLCLLTLTLSWVFATSSALTLKLISVNPQTGTASANGVTWSDVGGMGNVRRCLSSAFEMPGQSWSQNVSAGGITELNVGSIDPRSRGQVLATWLHLGTETQGDVVVLVVDHFLPVQIQLEEGAASKPKTYSLSHGSLVLDHLRAVLVGAGFQAEPGALVYRFPLSGNRVHLYKVEVGGRSTLQVVTEIRKALQTADVSASSRMVINMSLAMIPCQLQENYDANKVIFSKYQRLYRFNDYLHDLYLVNPQNPPVMENQFIASILNPASVSANEPLYQFVTNLHFKYPQSVVVASSGNYGLQISTMPAAWPGVVGVGASDPEGNPAIIDGLKWPDVGDVTEVGQWFHLQTADSQVGCARTSRANCVLISTPGIGAIGEILDTGALSYRGTSFSAPTVTAYIAMAMLAPTPQCVPPHHPLPANQFLPATSKLKNEWLPSVLKNLGCP